MLYLRNLLFYHLDVFFRAYCCAKSAAFAKIQVSLKIVFPRSFDAGFRADQDAQIAAYAIFVQEPGLILYAPGTRLVFPA
jgi:hypothetical protein